MDDPHDNEEFEKPLKFNVNGQGTFFFTCDSRTTFSVLVSPEDSAQVKEEQDKSKVEPPTSYIALRVTPDYAKFTIKVKDIEERKLTDIAEPEPKADGKSKPKSVGVNSDVIDTYWYSFDSLSQVLKYGKGYTMESTTVMECNIRERLENLFPEKDKRKEVNEKLLNPHAQMSIWVYSTFKDQPKLKGLIELQRTYSFREEAFVSDFPPLILDSSKVTLFDLDRSEYMFSSSLPLACQELYANIKDLVLEEPADPVMKLSDAIRYSINTEGRLLYKKLEEKKNKAKQENKEPFLYLRVTLGPDQRRGPGIPYVLEIWPTGSHSPIHNHGGSCAIIKVLFGRITAKIFNKMSDPQPRSKDLKHVKIFDCKKEDVTWISPDWYQTHQLENRTDDFCATIQCYRYTDQDKIHYDGFDYIPGKKSEIGPTSLDEFLPDSDFTFVKMRFMVLEEYRKYLSGIPSS